VSLILHFSFCVCVLSLARRGHTCAVLPDGSILLMAGVVILEGATVTASTSNDVWRSTSLEGGKAWSLLTANAEWGGGGVYLVTLITCASICMYTNYILHSPCCLHSMVREDLLFLSNCLRVHTAPRWDEDH
jgi:hypothetical protein